MSLELKPLIAKLNTTCRQAFEHAAELCVSQTHYSVEIEHLLSKLLEQTQTDSQLILRHYDIALPQLKRELTRTLEQFKRGNERTPTLSPLILTLLREAWLIASLRFNGGSIRSGALLLALIDHDMLRGGIVETLPSLLKIPRDSLRQDLVELVKHSHEVQTAAFTPEAEATASVDSTTPALDQYTLNLTQEARMGRLDPIEGRDSEIRQIIDILMRRRQNNPILTGDAGVGKTAVVEGFALRIAANEVPPALTHVAVHTLDLGLLQAGAGMKGEFENRLKSVINEVKAAPYPIVLFIDEAHTLVGAGAQAGQGDAANLLKPALARGELRTIAATTWSEYKKYFEKDAALTRRFQVVKVAEPTESVAIIMLRTIVANLERHHQVRITDEAVRAAVQLSHRYISGRQLPDKAVSVLDTACARLAMAQNSTPPNIEAIIKRIQLLQQEQQLLQREHVTGIDHQQRLTQLTEEIEQLQHQQVELEQRWQQELQLVKNLLVLEHNLTEVATQTVVEEQLFAVTTEGIIEEEIIETTTSQDQDDYRRLQQELHNTRAQLAALQNEDALIPAHVDSHLVASVIAAWTGIPIGKMLSNEIETVLSLKERMAQRLIGQVYALNTITRRIQTYRAHLDDPNKPMGVFLLVGPSGVGKTETALTLAELLYGGEDNLINLNMSEYQEAYTISSLKGSPPGYVGYGQGGVLTEAVRRNPYSVILLDEIEKAHPDVIELFYQVFDKGTLEDSEGVEIDFKNTLIFLTSNMGTQTIMRLPPGTTAETVHEAVRPELLKHFKSAFLGRLIVVPYHPLTDDDIRNIAQLKLAKIQQRFLANHHAQLTYDDRLIETIVARCTEVDTGARNIDHILTETLLPALSIEILERMASGQKFSEVAVSCDDNEQFCYQFIEA